MTRRSAQRPVARVRLDESTPRSARSKRRSAGNRVHARAARQPRRRLRTGAGWPTRSAAGWKRARPRGLVVFDASDRGRQAAGRHVFAREIEQAGQTARLAAEAGRRSSRARLSRAGDAAGRQPRAVSHERGPPADQTQAGRIPGRRSSTIEPHCWSACAEHRRSSARTCCCGRSCRTRSFPTVCYVAGPNELAYLGQLRRVYERFPRRCR